MFLRAKSRHKDGKEHRYWSIVENRRSTQGRVVQRQVLYLGEINDSQRAAWCRALRVFGGEGSEPRQIAIFPHDREPPETLECEVVQVRLDELELHRPRQWGGCWLANELWRQLELAEFWAPRLKANRQGTRWLNVFKTVVYYALLDPGSEWRLHRHWYDHSAMSDILGEGEGLVQSDRLYRCLDRLLEHKRAMFSYLRERWESLFQVGFDVLLYDLTSTYFESDPPGHGKRRYGYSRDKRPDCVQVIIALIVTPDGLPLAYEVMAGNTKDDQTLKGFLERIEHQYGRSERVWVMDRGIPTEATLGLMRSAEYPVHYLVGTPRGRLSKLEKSFLTRPWEEVRESVQVKLLEHDGELYILAKSDARVNKERAMRQRRLKKLWARLHELQAQTLSRDELLLKLGAAKKEAGRAYGLVEVNLPEPEQAVTPETFTFALRRDKLRIVRRREGRYVLRSNLRDTDPAKLWHFYVQLTQVEQAFKELKSDLRIRPIYHQTDDRIEAHIFVAFVAYCLQVTLKQRLRALAPGLTPAAVLEKFSAMQMVDVHVPTTDGRHLVLPRYTQPNAEQKLLLNELKLALPPQPPPRLYDRNARAS
jgi:hypothetical protein